MLKKLIIFIAILLVLFAIAPTYIRQGLIHNFSDVTDYQIFENAVVQKGKSEPWNIATDYNKKVVRSNYIDTLEQNKSIAYLVIQNDSLLYEHYWKGYSDSSLSGSFSMAKSVISMLIGIAVEEGKIQSVEDYISTYIPEFDRKGTDTITVKDVLTMSAGLKWTESYWNIFGKTADIYYGDRVKKVVGNLQSEYAPGKTFYYSSAETQILGWILENVYQKPVPQLFSEKIWSKIGTEHDALWSLDKKGGVAKVFCCLNSNARDFARLGKLVLQNGMYDSVQIVPKDYLKAATSPASWLKFNGENIDFYGYQFWILHHKGLTIPYFRGVKGQFIFVIPEKNAIVVRLGEYVSNKRIDNHPPEVFTYIDAALEVLH
ncbi:MAG: beta-lactamase family protein [Chitinophagales bacterium]|nr:beta-lactamase family protein [Chitinophagales bacterium]